MSVLRLTCAAMNAWKCSRPNVGAWSAWGRNGCAALSLSHRNLLVSSLWKTQRVTNSASTDCPYLCDATCTLSLRCLAAINAQGRATSQKVGWHHRVALTNTFPDRSHHVRFAGGGEDRKSTRLNSSHVAIS